jgi:ketosteroid isomerase-like protein
MPTQVDTTRQILEHHLSALAAGHLDEILSDYTDESTLVRPEGIITGRQAIRQVFESGLASLFKPGTYQFTMDTTQVAGDVAYIVWHANCAAADIVFATDTFLIRNGKIAVQTFAGKIEAKPPNAAGG